MDWDESGTAEMKEGERTCANDTGSIEIGVSHVPISTIDKMSMATLKFFVEKDER